jgi:hypothetical protein
VCYDYPHPPEQKENQMTYWIQTYTGKRFDLENPRPRDVDITDIIQALSNIFRFNGHCLRRYSVLEHSIRVAEIVPEEFCFDALLHDAGEAYYGDITRPQKLVYRALTTRTAHGWPFNTFDQFIYRIDAAVAAALGTRHPLPEEVHHADNVLLATEARDLMGPPPEPWEKLPDPLPDVITPMHPAVAYHRFVELFHVHKPGK